MQIKKLIMQSLIQLKVICLLNCPEEIYLSEKLIDMHRHFDMARYARTGEANAMQQGLHKASGKDKVAICGYHGWHIAFVC